MGRTSFVMKFALALGLARQCCENGRIATQGTSTEHLQDEQVRRSDLGIR